MGSKSATVNFRCEQCNYISPKWMGKCPNCLEFGTLIEEIINTSYKSEKKTSLLKPQKLSDIELHPSRYISSGLLELDRILGGGIIEGALVLIGGEPGIGKSTLLLQVAHYFAENNGNVLIVSGEESAAQIKLRAERIGCISGNLLLVSESDMERIRDVILETKPKLVVIDSIQTMYLEEIPATSGSVSQIRECTNILQRIAKKESIPIFIIGHVTKEGAIAGPRLLEHIVDTVLYFEGGSRGQYRIIRATKNRFGSTNEIGVFEMRGTGLSEVVNPSQVFISERGNGVSGTVTIATMEGTRPLLVELQALVAPTNFAIPRRQTTGLDYNRMMLIIAVLEKKAKIKLFNSDIYINVVGGVKIIEPAADLGIALSTFSAVRDIPIDAKTVVFGEIGLGGEIRYVDRVEVRITECEKLGFQRAIVPKSTLNSIKNRKGIEIIGVEHLIEVFNQFKK